MPDTRGIIKAVPRNRCRARSARKLILETEPPRLHLKSRHLSQRQTRHDIWTTADESKTAPRRAQAEPIGRRHRAAVPPAIRPANCSPRRSTTSSRTSSMTPRAPTSGCCCSSPIMPQASNNLGCVLQAQGKLSEASARFAQALTLMPQLFDQFQRRLRHAGRGVAADRRSHARRRSRPGRSGCRRINCSAARACRDRRAIPCCSACCSRSRSATSSSSACSRRCAPRCSPAAERRDPDDGVLAFCCALAKQCFINEYVFATTPDEDAQVERLKAALGDAIASGARYLANAARRARDVSAAACAARRGRAAGANLAAGGRCGC